MKQLWVPAEPYAPTHWASNKKTYTHALKHCNTYHTQNITQTDMVWYVFIEYTSEKLIIDTNLFYIENVQQIKKKLDHCN